MFIAACSRTAVDKRQMKTTCMVYQMDAVPSCDCQEAVVCWTLPHILTPDTSQCSRAHEALCVSADCKLSRTFCHNQGCDTRKHTDQHYKPLAAAA